MGYKNITLMKKSMTYREMSTEANQLSIINLSWLPYWLVVY